MSRDEDSKSARTRTNALKNTSNREEKKFVNHFFLILHFFPRRNLPFHGKITHAKFHHHSLGSGDIRADKQTQVEDLLYRFEFE